MLSIEGMVLLMNMTTLQKDQLRTHVWNRKENV